MLQNADDAGASQIHFILDPQHHRAEKVSPIVLLINKESKSYLINHTLFKCMPKYL